MNESNQSATQSYYWPWRMFHIEDIMNHKKSTMTIVNLDKYFERVSYMDLKAPYTADLDTLKRVMAAQPKSISFENVDVVQNKLIHRRCPKETGG